MQTSRNRQEAGDAEEEKKLIIQTILTELCSKHDNFQALLYNTADKIIKLFKVSNFKALMLIISCVHERFITALGFGEIEL